MEYIKNGFKVTIKRGGHYTSMTIKKSDVLIKKWDFLPVLKSRIEAEENAERIAENYIK